MITNSGLLDQQADEIAYLENLAFGLFTANVTVTAVTVLADLTASEAAWAGYARASSSSWTAPAIIAGGAQTNSAVLLTFSNVSGAAVTFWGWFALNPTTGVLYAGLNIGATSIPNGSNYSFAAALNEQNTGP